MIHCRSQKVRRGGLRWLALGLAGFVFAISVRAQTTTAYPFSTNRPSILLIVADDLGYGDLACYGQAKIKTPNLDKLAAQGMRFTSCYAGSSVSAPSRAALLTGKDTGHATIRGDGNFSLQPEDLTVTQLLKSVDYRTGVIGEWGLGGQGSAATPIRKGFDEWFGVLNLADAQNYYPEYLDRSSIEQKEPERNLEISENLGGQHGKYSDDFFSEAALNFLRFDKPHWFDHYRPFFLYLPYTIPRANTLLAAKTGNGMEAPEDAPYSSETWPQPEKNKAAMITRLDRYVGTLMDKLVEQKIEKNTIVIFTSANGPHHEGGVDPKFFQSAGPFRGLKHDLYEGGIRVPFIVSWPTKIQPGTTSDLPCALWDFMPTALQAAEKRAPADLDGISILPTLLGQPQTARHDFLYWEVHDGGFKQAIRMGDWKALRFGVDGPLELYDLKTDPGEKTDVAAKNPDVIAQIETYLKTARTDDKDWPVKTAAETPKGESGQ
jgi:arylsulfatase A-like enzyme